MELTVTAKGSAKKNKRVQSVLVAFTLMVWAVMATSVRKGLPFLDAELFSTLGFAMTKGTFRT